MVGFQRCPFDAGLQRTERSRSDLHHTALVGGERQRDRHSRGYPRTPSLVFRLPQLWPRMQPLGLRGVV